MSVSGRILDVKDASYEWPKGSGTKVSKWEVNIQVGNETKIYHCYSKAIVGMAGKDITDYPTEPAKKAGYPDTIKVPTDKPFNNFSKGSGKNYVDNGPTTAWDTILMVAKDLVVAGVVDKKNMQAFQRVQWGMYNEMVLGKSSKVEDKKDDKKEDKTVDKNAPVDESEIQF